MENVNFITVRDKVGCKIIFICWLCLSKMRLRLTIKLKRTLKNPEYDLCLNNDILGKKTLSL